MSSIAKITNTLLDIQQMEESNLIPLEDRDEMAKFFNEQGLELARELAENPQEANLKIGGIIRSGLVGVGYLVCNGLNIRTIYNKRTNIVETSIFNPVMQEFIEISFILSDNCSQLRQKIVRKFNSEKVVNKDETSRYPSFGTAIY